MTKKIFILSCLLCPLFLLAQPNADFSFNDATLCEGDSTQFTNASSDYTNLHWFFGDGSDTWSREAPKHKYLSPGNYTVRLVAISDAGEDFIEKQISITPQPLVQIAVNPANGVINLGESASLTVSNGFADYLWSTGEISSSIDVFKEGYYWIKITDDAGCKNGDTTFISVIQEDLNVSSNILTPNSDGYNDYLEVKDLENYNFPVQLYIYNIRNEQIFHSSDYKNDWKGDDYPAGSYFYILKTQDRRNKTGTINILR